MRIGYLFSSECFFILFRMNEVPVIYENDEILIINKPCGLAVQGGEGIVHSVDRILPGQLGYPVHLVHRLDKETSGLLVVAKTPAAASKYITLLQQHDVKKEYAAIAAGCPKSGKGRLSDTISRRGREQSAVTFYELVKSTSIRIPADDASGFQGILPDLPPSLSSEDGSLQFSLLHLTLGTGRMHQIRIHLAQNGFPILADDKYGNFKINKFLQKQFHIKKLALAAIRLTLPVDGKTRTFEVDLPSHMSDALHTLGFDSID